MIHADSVKQGYDQWAAVYDHDANPLPALEQPLVEAEAGAVDGIEALDLGCGTGRHAAWMAGAGARVTAVDFSEGMLSVARQKPGAEKVRFVEHDLHTPLPFESEFDLVVSGLVLEHLRDLGQFFSEVRRVLKPGGRAIVSGMHPAMFLRGSQARFTDPASGDVVAVGSIDHSISDCVMAALAAGLELKRLSEHTPTADFAERFPRAEKYVGWPMLLLLSLERAER